MLLEFGSLQLVLLLTDFGAVALLFFFLCSFRGMCRSEIKLSFRLELSIDNGSLECWNYDTNEPLKNTESTIPAYDHRRVRVIFKPTEVGERTFQLYLENVNNPNNWLDIAVSTSVTVESKKKLLFPSC